MDYQGKGESKKNKALRKAFKWKSISRELVIILVSIGGAVIFINSTTPSQTSNIISEYHQLTPGGIFFGFFERLWLNLQKTGLHPFIIFLSVEAIVFCLFGVFFRLISKSHLSFRKLQKKQLYFITFLVAILNLFAFLFISYYSEFFY